jgi:2-C-methyl-D-erythritol 4-phosphate cytidylyltransferase
MEKNVAIVLAGGSGKRMGSSIPKQYLLLHKKPVLYWSLAAFESFSEIDRIILVTAKEEAGYCRREIVERYSFKKVDKIVEGGAERYLSSASGLSALRDDEPDYVFIHDAARPLISREILKRALEGVREYKAAVVGMPVKDTIKTIDEEGFAADTPDRKLLWQIQTPQVFSYRLIMDAYEKLLRTEIKDITDDAMVVERMTEQRVKLIEGSYKNLKITTAEDLKLAEALMLP